jgi:hypothetical protein
MRFVLPLLLATLLGTAGPARSQELSAELASIRSFAASHGDRLWPGYGAAPFETLLIEDEREVLLCRAAPPAGFTADGRDAATGCPRHVRPRSRFPAGLLAAMPAFGLPATIVMGTPAATSLSLRRWRSTILHEHFHQYQWSLPDYWTRAAALDLAGGDQTGMWMLNFPFPYDRPEVTAAFGRARSALLAAVEARGRGNFRRRLRDYATARRAFASAAGERNWRYLELQLWQEGVARWTEVRLAGAHPDPAMRRDAAEHEREMLRSLGTADLAQTKRVIAYPYGMAEAMLLEACSPAWRRRYVELLALGPLIEQAARRCGR